MIKNTAGQTVDGEMLSATDGSAITSGTVTVYVQGDSSAQAVGSVGSGACTHRGVGQWTYAPAQAETNYDRVSFIFTQAGAVNDKVTIYTGAAAPDVNVTKFGGTAITSASGIPEVKVASLAAGAITAASIASDAITDAKVASDVTIASVTGAVGSVTGNVGGNVTGSVGSVASGGITAASFAADAITAAKIAADVTTELQSGLATASSLSTAQTAISAIKAVTDALPNAGALTSLATAANLATVSGYIDTEVAAIKAVTDKLDSAMELDLAVYRFTTNALEQAPTGGSAPSAATIADAVWDEARSGHVTAGTFGEGVASVTGNVAGSVASVASGGITAASLASDAITAAKVAADVGTEIAAAVLAAATAAPIDANVQKINDVTLVGNGTTVPIDAA
jgi:hypothetical protein